MNVTVTATLYREATFTLSSGTSVPTILAPAQNAVYQFTTVALSSPVLSLAFSPNSGYVGSSRLTPRYLKVYKPDGTLLADGPVYGSTINGISCNNPTTLSTVCTISMNQVPQTGAYKVVVQPYTVTGTNTVTATVNGLK